MSLRETAIVLQHRKICRAVRNIICTYETAAIVGIEIEIIAYESTGKNGGSCGSEQSAKSVLPGST